MPLAIWLPTKADFPILGSLFAQPLTAHLFSWFGAIYDLTIPFFLLNTYTRPFAYIAVITFHVLTKMLFNIGLFPWIMIFSTLIFFSYKFSSTITGQTRLSFP
ncbi:MAG: HTTM domain-containing protein [Saprospiraceae bacterium]|nr:HTTM domain-containing protein [Saprospiraceae bacterium]